jgi:hypothetical protein
VISSARILDITFLSQRTKPTMEALRHGERLSEISRERAKAFEF